MEANPQHKSYTVSGFLVKIGPDLNDDLIANARVEGIDYSKSFAPFHWLNERDQSWPEGLNHAFNEAMDRYIAGTSSTDATAPNNP